MLRDIQKLISECIEPCGKLVAALVAFLASSDTDYITVPFSMSTTDYFGTTKISRVTINEVKLWKEQRNRKC